ncbi:phage minor capsid protein [Ruminococcus bromii]|uniref:phage minor capsid protein n=2 Tax=Ruminococcus bromii TaxID=40518 RepID=UPI00265A4CED|nr:phage minor capsid protein [Ruminococcus bromii]
MSDYNIREAFEKIEDELIDSMMRNFSRHRAEETKEGYNWTQWQAEQLKSLEEYRKHNAKKFGKRFKTINSKVEEMIRTAKADGNASQEAEILEAVKDGFKAPKKPSAHSTAEFFKVNDRKLDALIKSTTDDLKRAETAVLRMSNDKYRKAIFNAQVAMNTGAVTYEKAVDMACKDMLNAGLNCVEYKNGARHTLSDYADMAVKTANKRAYLRGEGEKRAEWGVSLVVVNSRQGGCPDCAKYIGKVFIDDVYSNGNKSDGNYPLLSTAIKNGLFHPRCKDSTSTYYPELDDLDAPLSEDEIKELDRQRGIEEKQQYAQRQAERFDRRAEYSLDEDNKRIAQTRADEWHDRADMLEEKAKKAGNSLPESVAKSGKSGIINKKTTTVDANNISIIANSSPTIQDTKEFLDLLNNNSNDNIKRAYKNYSSQLNSVKYNPSGGCYRSDLKEISYGYPDKNQLADGRSKFNILSHEYGHFIDYVGVFKNLNFREIDAIKQSVKLSNNLIKNKASISDEFLKALRKDKSALSTKIFDSTFRDDLFSSSASAGVQDAICGMFGTKRTKMKWQHKDSNYNRIYSSFKQLKIEKDVQKVYINLGYDASNQAKVKSIVRDYETASETWANIMSAETCGGLELEYVKKYLPNSYSSFLNIMKELK